MFQTLNRLAVSVLLLGTLASAAFAGGLNARVEGPSRDGRTYVIRAYACSDPASLAVTAWAEGVVNGERRSLPLSLRPLNSKGAYRFERPWPGDGRWLVRVAFPRANAPVTVATIGRGGRVIDQTLVREGDGRAECDAKLATVVR